MGTGLCRGRLGDPVQASLGLGGTQMGEQEPQGGGKRTGAPGPDPPGVSCRPVGRGGVGRRPGKWCNSFAALRSLGVF